MNKTFQDIKPGDRVTILVPAGKSIKGGKIVQDWKNASGRAVIVTRHNYIGPVSHVALNMGGRFGMPGVATPENFVGFGSIE